MSNTVEIVAIGSELLAGLSVNSNAAYLSRKLEELGFNVQRHTVLPDDGDILREGLAESLSCNDLVIATGGLGPTCDDITKNVAAELFSSDFHFDESIANDLRSRYGNISTLENQATIPSKALLLKNNVGTAPGFMFSEHRGTLILLPGVPVEMKEMFEGEIIPLLKKHFSFEEKIFSEEMHFGHLYESAVDPFLRELMETNPTLQFGIYPRSGLLTVQVKGRDAKQVALVSSKVKEKFSDHLFTSPNGLIEEAIHEVFKDKKMTLSVAESCTGGALSAKLSSIAGASQFFLGGVVAYSNEFKISELNIQEALIAEKGAVSKEVAFAMAEGIHSLTKSYFSLSVTGIAGPDGGTEEKPVGTVFYAIKKAGKPSIVRQFRGFGSRTMIIEQTVNVVLSELYFETLYP